MVGMLIVGVLIMVLFIGAMSILFYTIYTSGRLIDPLPDPIPSGLHIGLVGRALILAIIVFLIAMLIGWLFDQFKKNWY